MAFKIGENVGPYRIISQLGQGGMATVYKAYHAALDRYVAVKVLHAAFKEDPTFAARFQREARVLAKLEHPSIVPIYDFAEEHGDPYLVMKYIEGDTLKARMAQGVLPMDEVLKVAEAVGAGLAYAHKQGILHRDIKPSNVIITHDGQYYLSDFGLARIASAGESTLSQDTMLGTPNYISPEQAKGVRDLDARTDIYSFGVLLYEMVVGRVPFSGDTPFAIIHDHIYTPLPLPTKVNPNVTEPIERVLLKALAKDRDDRYADAAAMVTSFRGAIEESGSTALKQMQEVASSSVAMPLKPDATAKAPAAAPTVHSSKPIAEAKPKPKQPMWVWVMGAIGGVVALMVIVALVVGAVRGFNRDTAQRTATARAGVNVPPQGTPPSPGTGLPPQPGGPPATSPFLPTAIAFVTANPSNVDGLMRLAQSYFESGRPGEAVDTYLKAADLARNDAKIYLEAARLMGQRDPIAALTVLASGLEKNPNNKEIQEAVFLNLNMVTTRPDAGQVLNDYVTRFPNSAVPRYALTMHYLYGRQIDKARLVVDEMVAKFPRDPFTYFSAGMLALTENRRDIAQREFEKVLAERDAPDLLKRRAQEQINLIKGTPAPQPQPGQPGQPGTPRP